MLLTTALNFDRFVVVVVVHSIDLVGKISMIFHNHDHDRPIDSSTVHL